MGEKGAFGSPYIIARFLQVIIRDRASLPVLLGVGDGDLDDRPTIEGEVHSSYIFVCYVVLFVSFSFSWSKYIVWDHPPNFNITFVRKYV